MSCRGVTLQFTAWIDHKRSVRQRLEAPKLTRLMDYPCSPAANDGCASCQKHKESLVLQFVLNNERVEKLRNRPALKKSSSSTRRRFDVSIDTHRGVKTGSPDERAHVPVYGCGKFHRINGKLYYLPTPMRQVTRIYKSHYFNGAAVA